MDSEWNADADPESQIVNHAILHIDRLEKKEEQPSQEKREDDLSEKNAYTFHCVHRPF